MRAKIGGDAAGTSCDVDCGAVDGAAGAGGAGVYKRDTRVRDGMLPWASCGRDEDEYVQTRVERRRAMHDGMRFAGGSGLCAGDPAGAVSIGGWSDVADARCDASLFSGSKSFQFRRVLPSSV